MNYAIAATLRFSPAVQTRSCTTAELALYFSRAPSMKNVIGLD
jgi:hypothetical protein